MTGRRTTGRRNNRGCPSCHPGRKLELNGPIRIVDVRIDQADRLPGAELEPSVDDRHHDRRCDECREDVVSPMPRRAVPVPPPTARGQQIVQHRQQVDVAARSGLEDGHAGRGVGHEDGEQAVVSGATNRAQRSDRSTTAGRLPVWIRNMSVRIDPSCPGQFAPVPSTDLPEWSCADRATRAAGSPGRRWGGRGRRLPTAPAAHPAGSGRRPAGERRRAHRRGVGRTPARRSGQRAAVPRVPAAPISRRRRRRSSRPRPVTGSPPTLPTSTCTASSGWPRDGAAALRGATRPRPNRSCGMLWRSGEGRPWPTALTPRSPSRRSPGWTTCDSPQPRTGWRRSGVGRAPAVVAELEALTLEHPLDERFAALLIRALCGCGARAGRPGRLPAPPRTLVDELGVDPSPELQELHLAVLRGERPPASAPAGSVGGTQPSRDPDQLRRPGRGGGADRQAAEREPAGDVGRTWRRGQDPARHRGRIVAARRVRLDLARRARTGDRSGRGPGRGTGFDRAPRRDDPDRSRARRAGRRSAVDELLGVLAARRRCSWSTTASTCSTPWRELVDDAPGRCPRLARAGDQPRAAGHHRRGARACSHRCPCRRSDRPWRCALAIPAVQLFADRAAAGRPEFVVDETTVADVVEIVPPARRPAARDRAGRRPAADPARRARSRRGCPTGSGCSPAAAGPRCPGTGRCAPWWSGAGTCSRRPSGCWPSGWRSSRPAPR